MILLFGACAARRGGPGPRPLTIEVDETARIEALQLFMLSRLHEQAGEWSAAIDERSRAVALNPGVAFLHRSLGELNLLAGRHSTEESARANYFRQAVSKAQDALMIDPEDIASLELLADAYAALGDQYGLVGALRRLAQVGADDHDIVLDVGARLLGLDHYQLAIDLFERYLSLYPEDVEILYLLAITHAQVGRIEEAEAELNRVLEREPDNLDAWSKLGLIRESQGRAEEAIEIYRRILEEDPSRHPVRINLAELLFRGGRLDEAYAHYRVLADVQGYREVSLTVIGYIQLKQGRPEAALETFGALLRENPGDIETMYRVAYCHELLEQWGQAAAIYEAILARRADAWRALEYLAQTYIERGQEAQALRIVEDRVERDPREARLLLVYGKILLQLRRPAAAVAVLRKAVRIAPRDGELHFTLGAAYEQLGDIDRAARHLRRSISIDPEDDRALNYLGYMLADHGIKLQEARRSIKRALELAPGTPEYLDSLGWVHYRMGEYGKAVSLLEDAVGAGGVDPVIFEHLGDAYKALGAMEKAREAYRRALELDADNETLREKASLATTER
jgi:tetratricopeptide (TPR) repeat protein